MFNKLTLAAVVAVAGIMMGGSEANAQNCRNGGYGYRSAPVYSSYRAPVRYASPYRSYSRVSPYRSGFGGYGPSVGFGVGYPSYRSGFGYGSPYYGRSNFGGRGGVSIGFGF